MPLKNIVWGRLRTCLSSIRTQSYPHWQAVLKTQHEAEHELLCRYVKKINDSRFIVVLQNDESVTQAANQALAYAIGSIITLFCHDDEYLPGAFDAVASKVDDTPWYFGKINYYGMDGALAKTDYNEQPTLNDMRHNNMIPQPACFWRRDAMDRVGMLDESFKLCWDYDYWIRLMKQYGTPKFIDYTIANYYLNANSISMRYGKRMDYEKLKVYFKHFDE